MKVRPPLSLVLFTGGNGVQQLFADDGNVDGLKLVELRTKGNPVFMPVTSSPVDHLLGFLSEERRAEDGETWAMVRTSLHWSPTECRLRMNATSESLTGAYNMVSDGVIDMYKASSGSIEIETDKNDQVAGTGADV